ERIEIALIAQLSDLAGTQTKGFSVVLHGGEPLLLGAARLSRLFGRLRDALPRSCSLHIQTNGILLTDAIIDVCVRYEVGISVSFDGPPEVHDQHRRDRRGRPSHTRVNAAIERLNRHASGRTLFSGVLAVVDPHSDPDAVYDYLTMIGAPSIDF